MMAAVLALGAALVLPGTAFAGTGSYHCGTLVYGAIEDKYLQLGAENGALGCPTNQESNANRGGRWEAFKNGYIFWHPNFGAHAVYGLIGIKWTEMGRENGVLGYPLTDESGTPDGVGRYNHFEYSGSIYWTPSTGAHAIYGAIRQRWASQGWERGVEGYPTSDESQSGSDTRYNTFQHGVITWTAAAGTQVQIKLHFRYSPSVNIYGTADLTLFQNGGYVFSGSFSTPSLLPVNGSFVVLLKSAVGNGFAFDHKGSVNDLPLIGHPTESWNNQGNSSALAADWPFIENGMRFASGSDQSLDIGGIISGLKNLVEGVNTLSAIVGFLS
jgi:uncharacterized protein with LGFP repeats